jgi:Transglycosylase SLT domain/D-alanyl-D-alanine carboxypeptidase
LLLLGALAGLLAGVLVLFGFGQALGARGHAQRAADLSAISAAQVMRRNFARLFEPPFLAGGVPNPRRLSNDSYLSLARAAALRGARRNGVHAAQVGVRFPDAGFAPTRVTIAVRDEAEIALSSNRQEPVDVRARATAEIAPEAGGLAMPLKASGGGYSGPLAYRQGKPMRPDVARAFDRMAAAARAEAGLTLLVTSGYRSDAEQARLFAAHPDPKWVAPPGQSLHRNATELDLGPPSAYPWLAANAGRFHFLMRYSWEPWHFGYTLNPRSTPRADAGGGRGTGGDGEAAGTGGLPGFVPARFAPALNRAAQRWSVSATLLAAQLYAESGFNPFVVSPAGAQGIAQFMPGTARGIGLRDPFDPDQAIDAQAHLMRDLLRQFGAVPLALAAYNAGPAPVQACGCVPAIPETRGYVARILGLMSGAGEPVVGGDAGLIVRLVE